MLIRASPISKEFHPRVGLSLSLCALFLLVLFVPESLHAEDIVRLQAGVVKIVAKPPQGIANVGTGFIVRLAKDAAYIVTAAHVVAGDQQPRVEFFTKRNLPVTAEVLGLEGNDEVRGLALLVVRGSENLPKGLTSLSLAGSVRLTGGEDIMVIGFPRNAGPWAIVKGNISSRQGRDIYFSPVIDSGHSGGPIFQSGKVVGVVGSESQSVGRGVTVRSVQDYIEGFGITAQESMATLSPMASAPSPPPAVPAKPKFRQEIQTSEITGKDGALMVLVPAGEFMMGDDKSGQNDERPSHPVYLGAFYIDQYEVTTSRYAKFFQETNRPVPEYWADQVLRQHRRKPVVGVDWSDATTYCSWAGKRLPTEAEWEKAARGTDQRVYPWGNAVPNATLANFDRGFDFKQYGVLTDVGAFEQGKSPSGAYDMAGNVWEWVADWYDINYYSKSPKQNPRGPSSGELRILRGGSWFNGPASVRSATRGRLTPSTRDANIGFRCAQDIPK